MQSINFYATFNHFRDEQSPSRDSWEFHGRMRNAFVIGFISRDKIPRWNEKYFRLATQLRLGAKIKNLKNKIKQRKWKINRLKVLGVKARCGLCIQYSNRNTYAGWFQVDSRDVNVSRDEVQGYRARMHRPTQQIIRRGRMELCRER